jgi:hypothetical protein
MTAGTQCCLSWQAEHKHLLLWLLLFCRGCRLLQDFHKMAQRCSAAATLHFFHSMNWVRDVKGASYIDMVMARKSALEADSYDEAEAVALVRRSTCFAL